MNHLPLLQRLFREIFENDELAISPATTRADVTGWDSLAHLKLILAIEGELGVRFDTSEVSGSKSVADLIAAIERHT